MQKVNKNRFNLWWRNNNGKRFHAGVAYYNEKRGDYALILSSLEMSYKDKRPFEIFLRPIFSDCTSIYYRVEKVIFYKGKKNRLTIGEAFLNEKTDGEIRIMIEPFTSSEKQLLLNPIKRPEVKLCA